MAKKQYFQESELVFKEKPRYDRFIDNSSKTFGKLQVLGFAGVGRNGSAWFCKCDCGNIVKVLQGYIKHGTKSCGCSVKERLIIVNTSHGMSRSYTYKSWASMIARCFNKNHDAYERYNGRGITVCDHWRKFENFLADMGERPQGLTLERKNNAGNYEPGNCKWATTKEQNNNQRTNRILTFKGESMNLTQWSERLSVTPSLLKARFKLGWSIERAFSEPIRQRTKSGNNFK